MRVNAREHVFLYITHFGTNDLPQLYVKNTSVTLDPTGPGPEEDCLGFTKSCGQ
jgi:hypothetical protein